VNSGGELSVEAVFGGGGFQRGGVALFSSKVKGKTC
jgi:hypothetical protein